MLLLLPDLLLLCCSSHLNANPAWSSWLLSPGAAVVAVVVVAAIVVAVAVAVAIVVVVFLAVVIAKFWFSLSING